MPIPFTCPHCGTQTNVADEYAGQSGPCASCGQTITVPLPPPPTGHIPPGPTQGSSAWVIVVVVILAVGLICGGGLIALLLPAVSAAREAARRAQCTSNLKQIAVAMHNYHDVYGTFPPAYQADENGKPMHSWRVLLLPYSEQQRLYEMYDFDEPWDGPNNRALAGAGIPAYSCPSDPASAGTQTGYMMIVGPDTISDGTSCTKIAEITDGSSATIMIVEVAGSGVHWMEPRDLVADELTFETNDPSGKGIRSQHPGGVNAALCDGSVHFLSDTTDPEQIKGMSTIAGDEEVWDF